MKALIDSRNYQLAYLALVVLVFVGCVITKQWDWILGFFVGVATVKSLARLGDNG